MNNTRFIPSLDPEHFIPGYVNGYVQSNLFHYDVLKHHLLNIHLTHEPKFFNHFGLSIHLTIMNPLKSALSSAFTGQTFQPQPHRIASFRRRLGAGAAWPQVSVHQAIGEIP